MFCVLSADIFYTKVIYHQCEPYWSSFVHEKAGSVGELEIAVLG